ncbi:MAG: DUF123 domain-containing protein, partial [Candidatus Latescibacteria bacterium]|nr:DUF123 domain-containing protein [bacterium]MBD3423740.1 DUF123 domain-containing protein [Candidatus Latescibacterota bacterium]
YVLIMRLLSPRKIKVGSIGTIEFEKGYYGYAGSAMGPGGLPARLRRHFITEKKQHWHIDYLRPQSLITEIWHSPGTCNLEHAAASALRSTGRPITGFGSSDCSCATHLINIHGKPSLSRFRERIDSPTGLNSAWSSSGPIGTPVLVISKCLTGFNCRYDSELIDSATVEKLWKMATILPVCPELEMGFTVPREPIDIIISGGIRQLIHSGTGEDLTDRIKEFSGRFLSRLERVHGFIMKGRSPSCGIADTPISGNESMTGDGFFSAAALKKFPGLPAANIEELGQPEPLAEFLESALRAASEQVPARKGEGTETLEDLWIREHAGVMARYLLEGD